jgi:hypothetical protein
MDYILPLFPVSRRRPGIRDFALTLVLWSIFGFVYWFLGFLSWLTSFTKVVATQGRDNRGAESKPIQLNLFPPSLWSGFINPIKSFSFNSQRARGKIHG